MLDPGEQTIARALAEFPALVRPTATPLAGGLIHRSFAVTAADGD